MARFQIAVILADIAKLLLILAIHVAGTGWFDFEIKRFVRRRWGCREPGKGLKVDVYV